MEPALLTRSGSTALSLPSARLRNLFRSELRSNGTSNSARRRLRDRICSASAVPEPARHAQRRSHQPSWKGGKHRQRSLWALAHLPYRM